MATYWGGYWMTTEYGRWLLAQLWHMQGWIDGEWRARAHGLHFMPRGGEESCCFIRIYML